MRRALTLKLQQLKRFQRVNFGNAKMGRLLKIIESLEN